MISKVIPIGFFTVLLLEIHRELSIFAKSSSSIHKLKITSQKIACSSIETLEKILKPINRSINQVLRVNWSISNILERYYFCFDDTIRCFQSIFRSWISDIVLILILDEDIFFLYLEEGEIKALLCVTKVNSKYVFPFEKDMNIINWNTKFLRLSMRSCVSHIKFCWLRGAKLLT